MAHIRDLVLGERAVLRAGIRFQRAGGVAFASDTVSITTMEIVDNASKDPPVRDLRQVKVEQIRSGALVVYPFLHTEIPGRRRDG